MKSLNPVVSYGVACFHGVDILVTGVPFDGRR